MKKDTENIKKEQLVESVDELTEENQRYFLGVLEALTFAQVGQGRKTDKTSQKNANHGVRFGDYMVKESCCEK